MKQQYEAVRAGNTVSFRPRGGSMRGRVESGALVTVAPLGEACPGVGEIVLCKVKGRVFLHLVKAVNGSRYLIGNNIGGVNGWTTQVVGRVTSVTP